MPSLPRFCLAHCELIFCVKISTYLLTYLYPISRFLDIYWIFRELSGVYLQIVLDLNVDGKE